MNIRQLRYFIALAETGSFTRAAATSHVAQPSLSQQIRALEAELGGELVERHARGISLTAAGEAFLPEAREAVNASERAREAAQRALRLYPAMIDVATVRTLAMTVLPQSIERWYRDHPDFRIRLHEFSDTIRMEEAVQAGSGLLGFGPRPVSWDGPLRPIGWDGLVAVLPLDDPLPPSAPVRLESLADRGWVLYERTHGLRPVIDVACEGFGFTPRPVAETGQVETAVRLAAAGLGPTLVPEHAVSAELRPAIRRLEPAIVWEVVAYARTPWPRMVDAYLDTFVDSPIHRHRPEGALVLEPSEHPPQRS
jgi:DNA-binding transcriptional LysR family regulator